jgi:hypothetical protein
MITHDQFNFGSRSTVRLLLQRDIVRQLVVARQNNAPGILFGDLYDILKESPSFHGWDLLAIYIELSSALHQMQREDGAIKISGNLFKRDDFIESNAFNLLLGVSTGNPLN